MTGLTWNAVHEGAMLRSLFAFMAMLAVVGTATRGTIEANGWTIPAQSRYTSGAGRVIASNVSARRS
jgi:hypothetical protein